MNNLQIVHDLDFSETNDLRRSSDNFTTSSNSNRPVNYIDEEQEDDKLNDNVEIDDEDLNMDSGNEGYHEDCMYKYADNNSDEEYEEGEIFDDDTVKRSDKIVSNEERITKPYITKYERNRLLGNRIKQILMGAPPRIKGVEHLPAKKIAELELKHKIMPLVIIRPLPDGKKEKWYIREFLNMDDFESKET